MKLLEWLKNIFTFNSTEEAMKHIFNTDPKVIDVDNKGNVVDKPNKSSRRLTDAEPRLSRAYKKIKAGYQQEVPGYDLVITQTFRSEKEQKALYAKGRTKPGKIVTYIDGVTKLGKHNHYPSKAIDVAVKKIGGKITWDVEKYKPLVNLAEEAGVISGGSWKKFKDYPHLEI